MRGDDTEECNVRNIIGNRRNYTRLTETKAAARRVQPGAAAFERSGYIFGAVVELFGVEGLLFGVELFGLVCVFILFMGVVVIVLRMVVLLVTVPIRCA